MSGEYLIFNGKKWRNRRSVRDLFRPYNRRDGWGSCTNWFKPWKGPKLTWWINKLSNASVTITHADYETLKNGPDPDKIALAEAKIVNAQARLALAENAGPTAEQLTQAQVQVEMAHTHLDEIKSQIDKMIIIAPYDGIISRVPAKQGEWAIPGEIMIELMDTSGWKIETKNVGELQIRRIEIGQAVKVTVNAFKDEKLTGQVTAISPIAVVQQGDTTYTLLIELESTDLELWPGMTTQVEIIIESD